jgi:NAD(P)-dependent dehydrogenase (short-subunit alcohol dehydrogenase family)
MPNNRPAGSVHSVSTPKVGAELISAARSAFGRLDHVVCNAGIDIIRSAVDYTSDEWDKILDVNLRGAFFPAQAAARHWIAAGAFGSITMTSSIAGSVDIPMLAPYAASKGGINQLVRTLATEWAEHAIRVNAVAPGYVESIMDSVTANDDGAADVRIGAFTPLRRRATVDEIAAPFVFLASDAASYVTGSVLAVDGGHRYVTHGPHPYRGPNRGSAGSLAISSLGGYEVKDGPAKIPRFETLERTHIAAIRARGRAAPASESEVAAGRMGQRFRGSDVVVEEGAEVTVSGLGGDPVDRGAVDGGSGGVASPERVAGDRDAVEAGLDGACLHEPAHRPGPDAFARGNAGPVDPGEQRTGTCRADLEPAVECPDGVGLSVLAAATPTSCPWLSWSVLERWIAMRTPAGFVMMSARSRAESSPGRSAEA